MLTARGAAYELEKALELKNLGEEIIHFGLKNGGREFDIITKTKIIECKNMIWELLDIKEFKGKIVQQKNLAEQMGKIFELHSKTAIPEPLKQWFKIKNIVFIEG